MHDSRNTATRRRQARREELNEYLSERGKLSYVFDNIEKMEKEGGTIDPQELNALKTANDQRIRLLGKYIPDLKAMEFTTGEDGVVINIGGKDAAI
jgi:hypothetical protein